MLERFTEWLAGNRSDDLVPSHFGFNVPWLPWYACAAILVITGVAIVVYYWRRLAGIVGPVRPLLVALRTAAVIIVLFLAMDPSIIAKRIEPGEQVVALLFDDSQSMRIEGLDGQSRGNLLLQRYEAAAEQFEGVLRRKHQVARYRLGQSIEPLQDIKALRFDAHESDLTGGISSALADMAGARVSAVVLFSDGVQQTANAPVEIADLPETTPVFTVGVDTETDWRDIEIGNMTVNRTDFDKSPVVTILDVHATGLSGRQADVEIRLAQRTVARNRISIGEAVATQEVRLEWIPDTKDWLNYEAAVTLVPIETPGAPATPDAAAPSDDRVKENNARSFIVDNRDKSYRILYVSGRPNWEAKFVRRAVEEDKQLKLTGLLCISTAERKFVFRGKKSSTSNPLFEGFEGDKEKPRYDEAVFIRLGAREDELVSGYPTTAEELFEYDLIVWGDVERELFTAVNMELTRDFVEKRGGSFLLMGGPRAFTKGNFAGTLVEGMLPFVLYQDTGDPAAARINGPFAATPTMEGTLTGSWSLDTNEQNNRSLWSEMPPLFGLDRFPLTRAAATVMAEAKGEEVAKKGEPLFAVQRYGEGRCAAFATSDTWQWQMRMPEDDNRHERLWRQIVRNLVHDAPAPVVLRSKQDSYPQGAPADFEFIVRDKEYDKREGLRITVTLTDPAGETVPLPVDESIQETGLYASRFTPEKPGLYRLALSALDEKDQVVGTTEDAFLVESDDRELQRAQYNPQFLKDISAATGGAFHTLDQLPELARAIPLPARPDAEEVLLHFWHLPGFYFALVAMLAIEWFLRRRRGRA